MNTLNSSIFNHVSKETVNTINNFIKAKKVNYLVPTKTISIECAQAGYVLNSLYNQIPNITTTYNSFFCNSEVEATQGAIKILRHNSYIKEINNKNIYIISKSESILSLVADNTQNTSLNLVPGLFFPKSISDIQVLDRKSEIAGIIIDIDTAQNIGELQQLKNTLDIKVPIILNFCGCQSSKLKQTLNALTFTPDGFIFGEKLTNNELPFGVFSVTKYLYSPWSSKDNCLIHSSTFGGGGLVLSIVMKNLIDLLESPRGVINECLKIESSTARKKKAFSKYVSPGLVQLYDIAGLHINPRRAEGSILETTTKGRSRRIYDCVTGGGAVSRGHNPVDIEPNVLQKYDTGVNYWQSLQLKLSELTGFKKIFPAVSGAGAVECSIILALLANPGKKKILIFDGNYAGKTLVALIGTAFKEVQKMFYPLYPCVEYLDPYNPNILELLEAKLLSKEFALVWFEPIQGATCKPIPQIVIDTIMQNRAVGEYLVGIDEILSSFYRTSPSLFYHKVNPDFITVSKALSDGVTPIGLCITSENVYANACLYSRKTVDVLEQQYINQFSSLVALNAIEAHLQDTDIKNRREKTMEVLKHGMASIVESSSFVKAIEGSGFLYHIEYEYSHPVIQLFGGYGEKYFSLFMCQYILKNAGVYIFFEKLVPPLNLHPSHAETIVSAIKKELSNSTLVSISYVYFMFKTVSFLKITTMVSNIVKKLGRYT